MGWTSVGRGHHFFEWSKLWLVVRLRNANVWILGKRSDRVILFRRLEWSYRHVNSDRYIRMLTDYRISEGMALKFTKRPMHQAYSVDSRHCRSNRDYFFEDWDGAAAMVNSNRCRSMLVNHFGRYGNWQSVGWQPAPPSVK